MNANIISALETILRKEKQDKNVFKARAYAKVIAAVKDYPKPITNMEDVSKIEGVGERIREKIKEVLETGHLVAADKIKEDDTVDAMESLLNIYGVGPAKAKELLKAGIRTVNDLKKAIASGDVTLNEKQTIGLKYYDDILKRIPRAEVIQHERIMKAAFPSFECQVVGSYRRGAVDSGDVDVLVKGESRQEFASGIYRMRESGYIIETLAEGPKKFMGVAKVSETGIARRIDILLTPSEEFGYAILYFTGSDKFNVAMRKHAISLGWSLNEHGLTALNMTADRKKMLSSDLSTEEAIFEFLGVPWVAPTERSVFPKIT